MDFLQLVCDFWNRFPFFNPFIFENLFFLLIKMNAVSPSIISYDIHQLTMRRDNDFNDGALTHKMNEKTMKY